VATKSFGPLTRSLISTSVSVEIGQATAPCESKSENDLDMWVMNWTRAKQTREFIAALEKVWAQEGHDLSPEIPKGQRILWMKQQADRLAQCCLVPPQFSIAKANWDRGSSSLKRMHEVTPFFEHLWHFTYRFFGVSSQQATSGGTFQCLNLRIGWIEMFGHFVSIGCLVGEGITRKFRRPRPERRSP
jgi:hypothetical protein